jgi:hypothetical protein
MFPGNTAYTAYIKPNIMDLAPTFVKFQKLDIKILSNNSVSLKISEVDKIPSKLV